MYKGLVRTYGLELKVSEVGLLWRGVSHIGIWPFDSPFLGKMPLSPKPYKSGRNPLVKTPFSSRLPQEDGQYTTATFVTCKSTKVRFRFRVRGFGFLGFREHTVLVVFSSSCGPDYLEPGSYANEPPSTRLGAQLHRFWCVKDIQKTTLCLLFLALDFRVNMTKILQTKSMFNHDTGSRESLAQEKLDLLHQLPRDPATLP